LKWKFILGVSALAMLLTSETHPGKPDSSYS